MFSFRICFKSMNEIRGFWKDGEISILGTGIYESIMTGVLSYNLSTCSDGINGGLVLTTQKIKVWNYLASASTEKVKRVEMIKYSWKSNIIFCISH